MSSLADQPQNFSQIILIDLIDSQCLGRLIQRTRPENRLASLEMPRQRHVGSEYSAGGVGGARRPVRCW